MSLPPTETTPLRTAWQWIIWFRIGNIERCSMSDAKPTQPWLQKLSSMREMTRLGSSKRCQSCHTLPWLSGLHWSFIHS